VFLQPREGRKDFRIFPLACSIPGKAETVISENQHMKGVYPLVVSTKTFYSLLERRHYLAQIFSYSVFVYV
jgi:hypothetical protein